MDKFDAVKRRLTDLACRCDDISAIVTIGSQARTFEKADVFSDLDIILVTNCPEDYLCSDDKLSTVGDIMISFTEPTIGGVFERRVLFDGSLDVDIIPLRPEEFSHMLEQHIADSIFSRGYSVLYDNSGTGNLLRQKNFAPQTFVPMDENEFLNAVGDFWYHTVWCAKKVARGELWTALTCVDGYLKQRLLRMIELSEHTRSGGQRDVWHNGRLMERWVCAETVEALGDCFGRYDRADIIRALNGTAELYGRLARECARVMRFDYPSKAEEYARSEYSRLLEG